MATVYIALGSNLGDRERALKLALQKIGELPNLRLVKTSSFYDTDPVDVPPQGKFLNAAAKFEIDSAACMEIFHSKPNEPIPEKLWSAALAEANELLSQLQKIEVELGRPQEHKQSDPRTIDLDLLDYGGLPLVASGLQVPHPRLHQRRFVLEPLVEIEPEWFHPVLAETAAALLKKLP